MLGGKGHVLGGREACWPRDLATKSQPALKNSHAAAQAPNKSPWPSSSQSLAIRVFGSFLRSSHPEPPTTLIVSHHFPLDSPDLTITAAVDAAAAGRRKTKKKGEQ